MRPYYKGLFATPVFRGSLKMSFFLQEDAPLSRLGIGTVQFGMDYGFTKKKSQEEVDQILDECIQRNINFLDTARDYGDSEFKIGHFLKTRKDHPFTVATKISHIAPEIFADRGKIRDHVKRSTEKSMEALGLSSLPILQTHQGQDKDLICNNFWDVVRELKEKKIFKKFGVSVYEVEPVKDLIFRYADQIDFIQIPFNLLDERFWAIRNLLIEKKIKIISRSAFLKGVLTSGQTSSLADFPEAEKVKGSLSREAAELNLKLEEYAFLHALSQTWITSTVIGLDSVQELRANADLLPKAQNFNGPSVRAAAKSDRVLDPDLIDPRKWGQVKVLAILQARMSSSRLPGKVLKPILGEPMLWRQIERVHRARKVDKLIVATSTDPTDDPVEEFCRARGIDCFRGDLARVLDRYYQAALKYRPKNILRLTGDCPLSDPEVIDKLIDFFNAGNFDYASNTIPHTYPNGLDAEIFTVKTLGRAWQGAVVPYSWEHVTPFIYGNPQLFKLGSFVAKKDLSALRWTVDTKEDFEHVSYIYENLYPKNPSFTSGDILDFLSAKP